jgi:hypothetical protein
VKRPSGTKKDTVGKGEAGGSIGASGEGNRPSVEELEKSISDFRDLINEGGYDLIKLTEQFAAGYHGQDWARIIEALQGGGSVKHHVSQSEKGSDQSG